MTIDTRDLYFEKCSIESDLEDGTSFNSEDLDRLDRLNRLADQVGDEFMHGAELIPADEFEDYVKEMIDECYTSGLPGWIVKYIDWNEVAYDLRSTDYNEIEFEGVTYYCHI